MALTRGTTTPSFEFIESLEPRILLAVVGPTNYEQYMLELINLARANPAAEAAKDGISLNEGVPQADLISTAVMRQPLAFNQHLIDSSRSQSTWMLAHQLFQHTGANGSSPGDRMTAAGYAWTVSGENIAWESPTAPAVAMSAATVADLERALFVDAGFDGRGHRVNLLDPSFREVGVGAMAGTFKGYNALMITQDFAAQGGNPFITGVVFDDSLVTADEFYTPGEGMGKVTVRAVSTTNIFTTTTWDSGGYSLQVPTGVYTVTFSGGTLKHAFTFASVVVTTLNVKQDFLTNLVTTSMDLTATVSATGGGTVYARPGADITLSTTVRNGGTEAVVDTFSVGVYQSDDAAVTTADTLVDSYTVAGLKVAGSATKSVTFAAPATPGTYYLAVMADNGDAVAESAEENNWSTTLTLIVGEPNLVGSFGTVSLPATIVPGDKGTVRFSVTNTGQIPATGKVDVKIYASADDTGPDAGDTLLLTFGGSTATWMPGQTRNFSGTAAITDVLAKGTCWLVADVDTQDAVAESDENNVVVAADTHDVKWEFGTVDGRTNAKLSVHDAAGAMATFSMSGPGWGEVLGDSAFTDTVLHGTTVTSAFTVTSAVYRTTLGDIDVLGSIKSITAKARLTGNIDVAGGIATLSLLDVDPAAAAQSTIALHTDGALTLAATLKATLTLGAVHDLSLTTNDLPIKTLTAIGWLDTGADTDVIQAPSIARLTVSKRAASARYSLAASAGDFQADLDVTGALTTATVAGSVNGAASAWDLGTLGSATVTGDLANCVVTLSTPLDVAFPKHLTLSKLTVTGWLRDSRIASAGNVGTVTAGGLWNADIFAGVNPLPLGGLPDPATDLLAGVSLAGVTVRGTVKTVDGYSTLNANIAAYGIGSVSLVAPLATNDPSQAWGLAYHTLKTYTTRTGTVRYTWNSRSADLVPTQPGGDFIVRQA
jgi:hypothetical protein